MSDIVEKIKEKEPESIVIAADTFAPWAISKIKTGQQCPLKFYLQYIIKLKHGIPTYSLITDVGKAAHRIIENIIIGKTVTDSFSITRKEFEHIPDYDWNEKVASLEMNVIEFREKLDKFEKQHPVKRYIQELKVGVTKTYETAGFFGDDVYFRGVIDLGMHTETDDVIILDHKTGAPSKMGIRNFKSQLDAYKLLFHHGIQKVNGAQAGIHFVKDGQVILDDYITSDEIETRLTKELEFYIQGTIDRIKEIGYFKHIRGPYCEWCDYNEPCRQGKLIDIEKQTIRFFKKDDIRNN